MIAERLQKTSRTKSKKIQLVWKAWRKTLLKFSPWEGLSSPQTKKKLNVLISALKPLGFETHGNATPFRGHPLTWREFNFVFKWSDVRRVISTRPRPFWFPFPNGSGIGKRYLIVGTDYHCSFDGSSSPAGSRNKGCCLGFLATHCTMEFLSDSSCQAPGEIRKTPGTKGHYETAI